MHQPHLPILKEREKVKEQIKLVIKEIKGHQQMLIVEQKEESLMGFYEDCGEFYRNIVRERESTIRSLIQYKITLGKMSKKLKYLAEEVLAHNTPIV